MQTEEVDVGIFRGKQEHQRLATLASARRAADAMHEEVGILHGAHIVMASHTSIDAGRRARTCGGSNCTIQSMSGMSMPRAATSVHSSMARLLCAHHQGKAPGKPS